MKNDESKLPRARLRQSLERFELTAQVTGRAPGDESIATVPTRSPPADSSFFIRHSSFFIVL
jgi:hypothetical protein